MFEEERTDELVSGPEVPGNRLPPRCDRFSGGPNPELSISFCFSDADSFTDYPMSPDGCRVFQEKLPRFVLSTPGRREFDDLAADFSEVIRAYLVLAVWIEMRRWGVAQVQLNVRRGVRVRHSESSATESAELTFHAKDLDLSFIQPHQMASITGEITRAKLGRR